MDVGVSFQEAAMFQRVESLSNFKITMVDASMDVGVSTQGEAIYIRVKSLDFLPCLIH